MAFDLKRTDNSGAVRPSRRALLGALITVPIMGKAPPSTIHQSDVALGALGTAINEPAALLRTSEGRKLSRFRYHNAEALFRSSSVDIADPLHDAVYSFGIVIQLGLSAHLLDVGFDDRWCARNIGLHVARSLACANATGFGFESPEFELLAALLSPYSKWRNSHGSDGPDFPFTANQTRDLVRSLLDQVHAVTGHPRRRVWRISGKS